MKTATHGTDEGRLRVKGMTVQPQSARDGNRKAFSPSILRFLCPPTLPLCQRTQSLSIVCRFITLHAGTPCEEFTWLLSKISWNIWQISCDIGDCRRRWHRKLWKTEARCCQSIRKLLIPFAQAPAKCGKNSLSIHVHWGIRVRQTRKVLQVRCSFRRAGESTIALKWGGRTDRAQNCVWRRSGQSITASDFGSNGPRFESGRGRCVESLVKALYSHCPKEKPSY